jgi:hypothetical protein
MTLYVVTMVTVTVDGELNGRDPRHIIDGLGFTLPERISVTIDADYAEIAETLEMPDRK